MTRTEPDCPLCRRLEGLDRLPPGEVVWRFPNSVALLGPWQFYTGYCILVSNAHAGELSRLPRQREFLAEMALLAEAIEKTFSPRKMNCESLGNQVPHPHWHLFPRAADDPDPLRAVWFELEKAEASAADKARLESGSLSRAETARLLRETLEKLVP